MTSNKNTNQNKRYSEYLESELEAAAIYASLAEVENDENRAAIFRKLVNAEMRHAARWADKLGIDSSNLKPKTSGPKILSLKFAAKLFGTNKIIPLLLKIEAKEVDVYAADPEAQDLVGEERQHSVTLRNLTKSPGATGPWSSASILRSGGSLRAAILGMNDGLISNFSLAMGVAGGTNNPDFVLLAGIAGLLAGAFSMASGEYISMRSQKDVYEHEILKEAIEIQEWPEEEEEELTLIYQAKGLSETESKKVAKRLMKDPEIALDTMAREELGLDPSQLGSPWGASISSFISFVVGAIIPIVPYILKLQDNAFLISAILSLAALAIVGGLLAGFSGKNILWGSFRMILAGSAAATVTYFVGKLVGISVTEFL